LGYLQSRPYDSQVAKRDAHDERYLNAIETLRAARKSARLTQTELAAKLGRRQQFVSKYESGERRLDIIEFLDAAKVLGLAADTLLRDLESWSSP
jgi:transcriptional regulator with XRE-family HTH domain